ncbi:alpha/beta fold hydrolase [Actinophytocola sp. NPDC049390]|uniref:alpha/beta fold hydrolase n=1 Tax=Actinophytocola sp. NPDC049390 TaxID=3363894 RepID=UPI00378D8471
MTVHIERGGDTGPTVLLLHGSGATAAVWAPVLGELDGFRWITVDLPGHGRSGWLPSYHHRDYAAAIGTEIGTEIDLVVGHSLGALVALTLADGFRVGAVVAMAMKVVWTPEQLARRAAQANRPPRTFTDRDDALRLFAKVSGLPENAPGLASGIRQTPEGYRLAADPRLTADPPATREELAAVMGRVTVPVRLVCGDADPGIEPRDMAAVLGREVEVIAGAGHNPHLDDPARVAALISTAARG